MDNLIAGSHAVNGVEIRFETSNVKHTQLMQNLKNQFPGFDCMRVNDNTIKISATDKIDISPIVSYLSKEGLFIFEARLLKPSLEEAFVKATGIEIDVMKKEKEKK